MAARTAAGIALAILFSSNSPASAQFCAPIGFGSYYSSSSSYGFGFGGGFGFRFGSYYQSSYFLPPVYCGPRFCGPPPYIAGWGYGAPWIPTTVIIATPPPPPPAAVVIVQSDPPSALFSPGLRAGYGLVTRPDFYEVGSPPDLPPIVVPERFVVVKPGLDRPDPPKWEPKRRPTLPDRDFGRFGGKPIDPPAKVPVDPKTAAVQAVDQARKAFTLGQYGRAGERLTTAIHATPNDPLPYFLLAQVRTAKGEYAEAVTSIRDGMKLAPDWPTFSFQLKALYGDQADRFERHLQELEAAVAAHPNDSTVLFLLGYHRWFLGEKDEALRLFRRAREHSKPNEAIERFLRETPTPERQA